MGQTGVDTGNGAGSASTQFKPGHPGRKGAKRGETGPAKGSKHPSRLLKDFRRVFEHGEEHDKTQGQKTLRKMLTESPKEFFSRMTALERAHLARETKAMKALAVAATQETPEEPDEGTERCLDLANRLLADIARKAKEVPIRDGRCVTCGRPVSTRVADGRLAGNR